MTKLYPVTIVTIAYVLAYLVTAQLPPVFVWGLEFSDEAAASLVFLPHGVRVLTAWLYGYWSLILLLPATLFTHYLRVGGEFSDAYAAIAPMSGVLCSAVAFDLAKRAGFDLSYRSSKPVNWRAIIIVGAMASVINSVGANFLFGNDTAAAVAYWVGDVLGLLAAMLALMLMFRVARKWRG
jgi:hypothetical protein